MSGLPLVGRIDTIIIRVRNWEAATDWYVEKPGSGLVALTPRKALPCSPSMTILSPFGYFLTRMLRDVIFQETDLVTPTGFLDRHRAWVVRGVYLGTAVIAGLIAAALVSSYLGNSRYVESVDQGATAYKRDFDVRAAQAGGDMAGTLQALNALRTLPGGYAGRDERGSLLGLGLGQEEKLGGAADEAYQRGLQRLLLPRLAARLEQQIRDNLARNEFLYEALKVYLMLATPQRRDPDLLKAWIERDVRNQYPGVANEALRQDFARHLDALLETGNDVAPAVDAALVAQARQRLLSLPLAQRVYAQIKTEQLAGPAKAWSLADRIPADQLRFFQRRSGAPMTAGIPYFFTADGYKEAFLKAQPQLVGKGAAETWVLGPEYARLQTGETGLKLASTVGDFYFQDYIKAWDELLNDLDVVPFQNIEQQVDLVRLMAQPDSPIKAILTAVSKETTLAGSLGAVAEAAVKAGEVIGAVQKTIDRLLGPSETAPAERVGADPAAVVDRHFEPINKLVRTDGQAPAPIDKVLASLNDLYAYLRRAELAAGQGTVPEGRELLARLDAEAGYQPVPLRRWLQGLTRTSSSLAQQKIGGESAKRVAAAFATTVAPECRNAIAGRYPMVKSSPDDVPLVDFGRFFGLGRHHGQVLPGQPRPVRRHRGAAVALEHLRWSGRTAARRAQPLRARRAHPPGLLRRRRHPAVGQLRPRTANPRRQRQPGPAGSGRAALRLCPRPQAPAAHPVAAAGCRDRPAGVHLGRRRPHRRRFGHWPVGPVPPVRQGAGQDRSRC